MEAAHVSPTVKSFEVAPAPRRQAAPQPIADQVAALERRANQAEERAREADARHLQADRTANDLRTELAELRLRHDSLVRSYERAMACVNLMGKAVDELKAIKEPV